MSRMKEEVKTLEATGSAGAGMVEVSVNGKYQVLSVKIDPEIVSKDDVSTLETLMLSAFNDASKKIKDRIESYTKEKVLSGGWRN